jgi:acylpyruvate hydrolase
MQYLMEVAARLVSYLPNGSEPDAHWRSGVELNGQIVDGGDIGWPDGAKRVLEQAPAILTKGFEMAGKAAQSGTALPLRDVRLGPVIPDPDKIICLGLNYRDHAAEASLPAPLTPILFAKFRNALIGSGTAIEIPKASNQVDFEGELAVVIGRRCRSLSEAEAPESIAGYTIFNDVSARDLQMATSQWTAGKAIDTFGPLGPSMTQRADVPDVQRIMLRTWLNGQLMQEDSTASMIFSVAATVAYISSLMTLEPGDVIATGTPAGVGIARRPPVFLASGDTVEVEIEGLGRLSNPVTAMD